MFCLPLRLQLVNLKNDMNVNLGDIADKNVNLGDIEVQSGMGSLDTGQKFCLMARQATHIKSGTMPGKSSRLNKLFF